MELQVTRVVAGRYVLEVPLGRGAWGHVWRGRDTATGRPVPANLVNLDDLGERRG